MMTNALRTIVFALALSPALIPASAHAQEAIGNKEGSIESKRTPRLPLEEAVADPRGQVQQLRTRINVLEDRLTKLTDGYVQDSVIRTNLYTGYVTFIFTLVTILGAVELFVARRWVLDKLHAVEIERREMERIRREVETQLSRVQKEVLSTIWISRTVQALARYEAAKEDSAAKRVLIGEANSYIAQAELTGHKDSHLLNWKGYTLKRTDNIKGALEAAREALNYATKPDEPQHARALYNIACYNALLPTPNNDEAFDYLNRAVHVNPLYREVAQEDDDLKSIRESSDGEVKKRFDRIVARRPYSDLADGCR